MVRPKDVHASPRGLALLQESLQFPIDNLHAAFRGRSGHIAQAALTALHDLKNLIHSFGSGTASMTNLPQKLDALETVARQQRLFPESLPITHREFEHSIRAIVWTGILGAAAILAREYNLHAQHLRPLGSGGFNWIVADGRYIIAISKSQGSSAFYGYRLREWCAQQLISAGVPEPRILYVRKEPFVHVVAERAHGVTLGDLMRSTANRRGRLSAECSVGLRAFGNFLQTLTTIPVEGYGPLEPSSNGYRGCYPDGRRAELLLGDPGIEEARIDLDFAHRYLTKFNLLDAAAVRILAIEARSSAQEGSSVLAHGDPHPANFLTLRCGRVIGLDLDTALALPPFEMVGTVLRSWILKDLSGRRGLDEAFGTVLTGMSRSSASRRNLREQTGLAAAVLGFRELVKGVPCPGSPGEQAPSGRLLREAALVQRALRFVHQGTTRLGGFQFGESTRVS